MKRAKSISVYQSSKDIMLCCYRETCGSFKKVVVDIISQARRILEQLNGHHYDYLVVGSGLFGSTFAYEAMKKGKTCLVIDRRQHVGGNVYCEKIEGITVHKYGAHVFHTDDKAIWDYVNSLTKLLPYTHHVVAKSNSRLYSMPFNLYTFEQIYGVSTELDAKKIISKSRSEICNPANLEEQAIAQVGREIYEKLVKGYTEKQWGKSCKDLPVSIISRLPVRFTYDDRYFSDKYQGIPEGGYNALINKMLAGIPTLTGISYAAMIETFPNIADKVLYTGPIDEYFEYSLGNLEYRSLRFEEEVLNMPDFQGQAVVNECDADVPWTRTIEHKHFLAEKSAKTVITREYPEEWFPGRAAYYPLNDEKNNALYREYVKLAEANPNVIFGGRLGSYKYYDMDDAIAEALKLASEEIC